MRHLAILGLFGGLSGCIIYEEQLVDDTSGDGIDGRPGQDGADGQDGNDGQDGSDGSDGEPAAPSAQIWLDPAGGIAGDAAIVSLYAEGDVDLTTIQDVQFFGDGEIDIVATDTRGPNEFLLTLAVPAGAALGANDLLVEFADGTALFVDAAFTVVTDASQIPATAGDPPASVSCE